MKPPLAGCAAGRAMVTGASSGLGRAVALELARRGWRLGLVGRNGQRLDEVAALCRHAGSGEVQVAALDMQATKEFAGFVAGFGAVDLYISNHGILDGRRAGQVLETAEVAQSIIAINLAASIAGLHAILPGMRERGRGQVVLVSSLAGVSPLPDAPAYAAAKAGLVMYGLSLREALRGEAIGVSVCCPGYVATAMGAIHLGNRPHEISAEDAACRIVKAALANRRLFGFPAPLWPMALFSLLVPEGLLRLFNKDLRFTVGE